MNAQLDYLCVVVVGDRFVETQFSFCPFVTSSSMYFIDTLAPCIDLCIIQHNLYNLFITRTREK